VNTTIGDLTLLKTASKDEIVNAVNNLYDSIVTNQNAISNLQNTVSNLPTNQGALVFNTLADLQSAYPNGSVQPAWIIADEEWYYWNGVIAVDTTPPVITASVLGGTYTSSQTVTLSSNEASTIYYTTDGSTPTTSSQVYSSALTISANTTLKYFGKDTSGNTSNIVTQTYTINLSQPDTTPPVITASVQGGTYTSSQTVTLSSNETNTTIYYTLDGTTPTTSSTVYSSALTISANTTLKYFGVDSAGNSSSVVTQTYVINIPDTTPPVITASPIAGTYSSTQNITLTSNESGTTIYYTTDGTTPTTSSTVYSSPIVISATTTLQYIGKDSAGNISTPVASTYTINTASYVNDSSLIYHTDQLAQNQVLTVPSPDNYFNGNSDYTYCTTAIIGPNAKFMFKAQSGATQNANIAVKLMRDTGDHFILTVNTVDSNGANLLVNSFTSNAYTDRTIKYHAVIRKTGTTLDFFINNVKLKTWALGTSSYMNTPSSDIWTIGDNVYTSNNAYGPVTIYNGYYYNRSLTDTELTQNYNALGV
jgi:hypothetical protein